MPDKESIKKFSTIVQSLGSEPQLMKERNEEIDDTPIGEEEMLPSDLSELIDAASSGGSEIQANGIEDLGNIDDFALDADLRKGVTPDLLSLDESESGIEGFGEGADQIDLGEGELPPPDVPGNEADDLPGPDLGAPIEDFSLPEDFSFGEEAGTEEPNASDQGITNEDISDFTLPDHLEAEPEMPSFPEDKAPESFDFETEAPESKPADQSSSFEEETPDIAGLTEPESFDFSSEEESLPEDIGEVSGFESIGESFDLPESMEETPEPGGLAEAPQEFEAPFENEVEESPFEEPSAGGTPPPGGGEEEFAIDELGELDLPEMGEQQIEDIEEQPKEDKISEKPGRRRERPGDEELSFTDREFTAIQSAVESLPRNLKLKVLAVIGKSIAKGDRLSKLITLLIHGAPATEIAELVTLITGEKIVIPRQFEKKTGLAYEEERRSFRYVFKTNIMPLLTIMIPMLLVLIFFIFISFKVASWFDAQNHYSRGLSYITKDKKFAEGNEEFDLGFKAAPDKNWFYKYADAFVAENQYADAQDKYEQLLGLKWKGEKIDYMGFFDQKGILDYAGMESKVLTNFKKADTLLAFLLLKDSKSKDGLLARGDNYLDWADSVRFKFETAANRSVPAKPETLAATQKNIDDLYESGRLAYAEYRNRFGDTIPIKFRFLRYFIRTDNLKMVTQIKDAMQENKDIKVDPLVYAELGGYLIDKKEMTDVRAVLSRAIEANPSIPEAHYHFARYLELMDQKDPEENALKRAIGLLNKSKPLTMKRILMLIDSHDRFGNLLYATGRTQEAVTELDTAIQMIETPEQQTLFGINPKFGEVYYSRGNILYDTKDFIPALGLYGKAKTELYVNPEMDYKIGYINYRNSNMDAALLAFYDAEQGVPENVNTLYSIGNTLFAKSDFFAAQGYYEHLIQVLERSKAGITSLRPKENPAHRTLLNFIMRAYNNLGITMKHLSEQPRNPRRESEALSDLTRSQEYYDLLERTVNEPGANAREKLTKNLAYLNQRAILYPVPGYDLYIYKDLPVDPQTLDIDDLFSSKVVM